ncbi:MAG: hypothetical protein HN348_31985 [Proteobacteria bacterium]|nr:hypothetical protein [Pseudomonadota bacterium]
MTYRKQVAIDVLQCQQCNAILVEEDWTAPLQPLQPGRCMNCGDQRRIGVCRSCGFSEEEDKQVHEELREHVDPSCTLLDAARTASKQGRRLIALKLATAAARQETGTNGDAARGLRVWLLSALGEKAAALADSKAWVESVREPSAMAWASYGQQLQHNAFPGAAADAFQKSLQQKPDQHMIRAHRAQLLLTVGRQGQALDETIRVFEAKDNKRAISVAIDVAEKLCDLLDEQRLENEADRLLQAAGPHTVQSAALLAHSARVAAYQGKFSEANALLDQAKRLKADLPIFGRVQIAIAEYRKKRKPEKKGWWPFGK